MIENIVWFVVGYLFGSFPTGYILAKMKGKDITKLGSGNIGGANVYRVLGPWYALITVVVDMLKGFVPVMFAPSVISSLYAAVGAITGSIFSLFLRGKGGKGFATLTGSTLALLQKLSMLYLLPVLIVAWITTVAFSRYTSLANIVTVSVFVPLSVLAENIYLFYFSVVAMLLIYYSHRENIARLLKGEERSFLEKVENNEKW